MRLGWMKDWGRRVSCRSISGSRIANSQKSWTLNSEPQALYIWASHQAVFDCLRWSWSRCLLKDSSTEVRTLPTPNQSPDTEVDGDHSTEGTLADLDNFRKLASCRPDP